jgi:hypothetical protein
LGKVLLIAGNYSRVSRLLFFSRAGYIFARNFNYQWFNRSGATGWKSGMKIRCASPLTAIMKKVTFSMLMLAMLISACSNPINEGGDDDDMRSSDTTLRTDPGDGVSTATDSLHKAGSNTGQPQVNTVTGQMMNQPQGAGTSGSAKGAASDSSGSKGMENTGHKGHKK